MNLKTLAVALAGLASTGFADAGQAPKAAAAPHVVVYKSPT
jgi:hypothetical protein